MRIIACRVYRRLKYNLISEECSSSKYLSGLVYGGRYGDNRYDNDTAGVVVVLISKPDTTAEHLENVERGQHLQKTREKGVAIIYTCIGRSVFCSQLKQPLSYLMAG